MTVLDELVGGEQDCRIRRSLPERFAAEATAMNARRATPSRLILGLAAAAAVFAVACDRPPPRGRYVPVTRAITVTTVPLLVKEDQSVFPFLKSDFAKGGVLEGKEVYGFSPSTITVFAGDTIDFTFYNPEDDDHSFVLPDLAVPLPPQKVTAARYVARRAGIFPFVCSVASHLPMMWGQLIVLAPPERRGED
jgi:plastocyanin